MKNKQAHSCSCHVGLDMYFQVSNQALVPVYTLLYCSVDGVYQTILQTLTSIVQPGGAAKTIGANQSLQELHCACCAFKLLSENNELALISTNRSHYLLFSIVFPEIN